MRAMPHETLEWWKKVALGLQAEMIGRGLILEAIREACAAALTTDGAHHKQWYLEQILQEIVSEEEYEDMRRELDWNPGTAP